METYTNERLLELAQICQWQAQIAHCPQVKAHKTQRQKAYLQELEKREKTRK